MASSVLKYFPMLWLALSGCSDSRSFETKEELQKYIYGSNNGFNSEIEQGDFKISATYLPLEFMLANEMEYLNELLERKAPGNQIEKQKEFIDKYKEGYEQNLYFKMVITPTADKDLIYSKLGSGFDSYSQWLQKLLFGIKDKITLVTSTKEEVPLLSYQMDRNFGTTTSRSFLLTFSRKWNEKEVLSGKQLTLRVDEFGLGIGRVQLPVSLPFPEVKLSKNIAP